MMMMMMPSTMLTLMMIVNKVKEELIRSRKVYKNFKMLHCIIQVLGTYNTALFEWTGAGSTVPSRTERRDAIIEQLNSTYAHAHVMCLQEVCTYRYAIGKQFTDYI